MATRAKTPKLDNVSGGEHVSADQVSHGLGRKDDMVEVLSAKAQAQGIEDYTLAPAAKKPSPDEDSNAIGIPMQKELVDVADSLQDNEAQDLINESVKNALKELLPAEALLYVPPEDFLRIREELLRQATELVKETRALATKHARHIPLNEETLRSSLRRDIASPKFRDRHYELFDAISRTRLPTELGTARQKP